jgi:hypothetical protein
MHPARIISAAVCLLTLSSNGEGWAGTSADRLHGSGSERRGSLVLEWNEVTLEAIRRASLGPPIVARALAVVHTCMYDAWAAYDPVARGTQLGASLRRPRHDQKRSDQRQAISVAAYRALVDLFPMQQRLFDDLMAGLGYDPLDTTLDPTTPTGVGNLACAAVLALRHADGSNQLGDINGGPAYSDYTGYVPINTPTQITDPNRWQPVTFADGRTPAFVAPHWGLVEPFAPPADRSLRPEPPAFYPDERYMQQAEDLLGISAGLTDREKMISEYLGKMRVSFGSNGFEWLPRSRF